MPTFRDALGQVGQDKGIANYAKCEGEWPQDSNPRPFDGHVATARGTADEDKLGEVASHGLADYAGLHGGSGPARAMPMVRASGWHRRGVRFRWGGGARGGEGDFDKRNGLRSGPVLRET